MGHISTAQDNRAKAHGDTETTGVTRRKKKELRCQVSVVDETADKVRQQWIG
eukprot:m.533221 g.533221  ORF g.533221 m.533221 type:complete len:52 (-) comp218175_c0_seq1:94-249(-)